MPYSILSIVAASSLATIIVILGMMRILSRQHSLFLLQSWLRYPAKRVTAGMAAALFIASILMTGLDDSAELYRGISDIATMPGQQVGFAPKEPTSIDSSSAVSGRALASLRDYADRIRGKQQSIASLESNVSAKSASPDLPDVDTMIERLAKRVAADPSNVDDLAMLGWSYVNTGKYAEGVEAYKQAVARDPQNSKLQGILSEAEKKLASVPSQARDEGN